MLTTPKEKRIRILGQNGGTAIGMEQKIIPLMHKGAKGSVFYCLIQKLANKEQIAYEAHKKVQQHVFTETELT